MLYQIEIEKSLSCDNAVNHLRQLAIDLNNEGLSEREIYDIFYRYYIHLQESGREKEEAILGDVMDMVTGWYAPYNLNLKR